MAGPSPAMTVENLTLKVGMLRANIEGRSFLGK
jgi:hypothetical protein